MNRLQKKCFFAASGFHLLLLVILIVGPAFLMSADKVDDSAVLTFIPMMTTDKAFAGGGNPNAKPPPPAPAPAQPAPSQPEPQVQPKPAPAPEPEPPKVTPDPVKTDPDSIEPVKNKKPKIQVNTKLVKRQDVKKTSKTSTDTSAADAQEAAARAKAFKVAAGHLREGFSSSTKVEMIGPGGGGPTYARYRDVVQKIYYDAWIEPNADAGIGTATIVIARDGTVVSARIAGSSGNSVVDRSIQEALDRVKFIAPFPDGATEEQRTYSIRFNLEAKKSLG